VLHVPLPGDILKCEPPEGAPAYCQGATPWTLDDVPDTITMSVDDFPADSVCRASAPGGSEQSRGGDQIDDSNGPAAE